MAIRNSEEIGTNLIKIASVLSTNQRLIRLLKYTDEDPLSKDLHDDLTPHNVLHKNIRVIPLVNEKEDSTESTVVLIFDEAKVQENREFKYLYFDVLVYVPLSEWALNDINLRPFLIISEIEKSLKGKKVESLGKINYDGFKLDLVTDMISCYKMSFSIDVFN